jgi:integrase
VLRAKGNTPRIVYANNGRLDALAEWLAIRGPESGPVFVPINKGGRLELRRLSEQAIYDLVVKRQHEAEIDHLWRHDLRRSLISDLLDAGADVSVVQQLAGHANVQTTLRSDRRPEPAKARAATLIRVPFVAGPAGAGAALRECAERSGPPRRSAGRRGLAG